jgi:hypothetical protein
MKNKSLKITIILAVFFLLFVVNPVKAQTEFGVKGGVHFSGLKWNESGTIIDMENRTGFAAGVFLKRHNLLGPIGLQTELLYQLKGSDVFIRHHCTGSQSSYGGYYGGYGYEDIRTVPWYRRSEKYHYLSIPLLLTFSPFKFLDVYAGPEAGYLISPSKSTAFYADFYRFSAGITAGASVKISDDTKLDMRYSEDVTRVNNLKGSNIKNYGFTVSLQKSLFNSAK